MNFKSVSINTKKYLKYLLIVFKWLLYIHLITVVNTIYTAIKNQPIHYKNFYNNKIIRPLII